VRALPEARRRERLPRQHRKQNHRHHTVESSAHEWDSTPRVAVTTTSALHHQDAPSRWIERFASLIRKGGTVLDLACGFGRHSRYLADLGLQVTAVDRDPAAIESLANVANVIATVADIESAPWPFPGARFDGIVVTNYLWRPLFPMLLDALDPGGVLLYETFAMGNEKFGKPSNPNFLLRPGELLDLVRGRLKVIAFEDLCVESPRPAMVQRLCAVGPNHPLARV
jgi:SAM-dependent methyltransferase